MSPERSSPKTGAGTQASTRISMRLTKSQLGDLNRFCTENGLTRGQVIRAALRHFCIQQAIRREEARP